MAAHGTTIIWHAFKSCRRLQIFSHTKPSSCVEKIFFVPSDVGHSLYFTAFHSYLNPQCRCAALCVTVAGGSQTESSLTTNYQWTLLLNEWTHMLQDSGNTHAWLSAASDIRKALGCPRRAGESVQEEGSLDVLAKAAVPATRYRIHEGRWSDGFYSFI